MHYVVKSDINVIVYVITCDFSFFFGVLTLTVAVIKKWRVTE